MISTDQEVFALIRSNIETGFEIDFLTYAIYTHEKHQWMELYRKQTGSFPSESETRLWISQITDFRFASYSEDAAKLFDRAARAYLAGEIEAARQEAFRNDLLNQVKAANTWWRQIAIALITSILAPLIIGCLIVAALRYDQFMITASDIVRGIAPAAAPQKP